MGFTNGSRGARERCSGDGHPPASPRAGGDPRAREQRSAPVEKRTQIAAQLWRWCLGASIQPCLRSTDGTEQTVQPTHGALASTGKSFSQLFQRSKQHRRLTDKMIVKPREKRKMHPPALRGPPPAPGLSRVFLGAGRCSLSVPEELHTMGVLLCPRQTPRRVCFEIQPLLLIRFRTAGFCYFNFA